MSFNWRTFFRLIFLTGTRWSETGLPMTPKRAAFLAAFFVLYPALQGFHRLCFLLDDLFYPQWRKTSDPDPVFIIGNPRSGTTLLHRILARDVRHFFTFHTWEILFPAVTQKKFLSLFGHLDRRMGGRLSQAVQERERRLYGEFNKIHRLGLLAPEEDDKLLFHHCSFHGLAWFFPFEEIKRFHKFDVAMPEEEKQRVMEFYAQCLRRQAFFAGQGRRLLSKNPASSLKVDSLYRRFPACRVIYMVRHPLEVVPSTINMAHAIWKRTAGVARGAYPYQEGVYEIVKLFYEYPLSVLDQRADESYRYVKYEDLVRNPQSVVNDLYGWLSLDVYDDFQRILEEESAKARGYVSEHIYSLDDMAISPDRIAKDLSNVFRRFSYEL
uniref:Sulfotransferase n=1 Tax=Desulfacinum infernum TaxID=35837 RepID=A0A831ZN61_9BACT